MNLKFATAKIKGTQHICFSREELLYMINQLDRKDTGENVLVRLFELFIEELEKEE